MTLDKNNDTEDIINDSNQSQTEEDQKSSSADQEFIFIHDTGFNVVMQCPGLEAFEIQVCTAMHCSHAY